jgi:DNA-binding HxlR family transcriptional regulator
MTARARPNPVMNCPLTAAWAAVGGKWKLTIIYWLAERPRHFAGLRRQLDAVSEGISPKVLAQQLRELIADNVVIQERTGTAPSPVIYSLTDYGESVLPMLELVRLWGVGHIERTRSQRSDLDSDAPPSCSRAEQPRP